MDYNSSHFNSSANGITATLNGSANGTVAHGVDSDTLRNIENLVGTNNADTLTGDSNNNSLSGMGGNDTLRGGAGADTLDGGAGEDTVDYSSETSGVTVNLDTGAATDGSGATDTLTSIEKVLGSNNTASGDDLTASSTVANVLEGNAGNDTLTGFAADQLIGGAGDDTLNVDLAALQNNATRIDGGADSDTLNLNNGGTWDLGNFTSLIDNVEKIDFSDGSADTITISMNDVSALTGSNSLTIDVDGSNTDGITVNDETSVDTSNANQHIYSDGTNTITVNFL
ncbi:hypothetical protein [Endozoicomonas sp. SESOKO4]|uniref:calcium-binding protein n=1 Tax=Endozoicomonas sp. SESOKO4 TaxID=2828745 RepID=UPI0021497AD6